MASELIVQTIQGPSSGSNANKVIIPSGHTLDASGGTLVPSEGQVVQVKRKRILGSTSHTSSTYTAIGYALSFSAKNSSSLLKISVDLNVSIGNVTSTDGGMKWSVFKDGVNLADNSQDSLAFYYMANNTHGNSHLNQSATFYLDAGDTSPHSYEVYTRVSHGTCQAKTDADWGTQFIEVTEIAQ